MAAVTASVQNVGGLIGLGIDLLFTVDKSTYH
jgi:hypothetical protein